MHSGANRPENNLGPTDTALCPQVEQGYGFSPFYRFGQYNPTTTEYTPFEPLLTTPSTDVLKAGDGFMQRLAYINSVPVKGCVTLEDLDRIQQYKFNLATLGLDLTNIKAIVLQDNVGIFKDTIAAIGRHKEGEPECTLYKCRKYDELNPFEQMGNNYHEVYHAIDAWTEKNASIWGGEERRLAAVKLAEDVTIQTQVTSVYLNPYHKHLHKQYKTGEISWDHLCRETLSILAQLGTFNRAGLMQKQESQYAEYLRQYKAGEITFEQLSNFRQLISTESDNGVLVDGIDTHLIQLMNTGNYANFIEHIDNIKAHVSTQRENQLRQERNKKRQIAKRGSFEAFTFKKRSGSTSFRFN